MFVNSREIHLIPAVLAALTVIPHLRDEWRQCLCIYGADTLLLIPSLFLSTWPGGYDTRIAALLENKLRRRLRLPEPDRCAAGCRVPRMVAYRCLAIDAWPIAIIITLPPLIAYLLNKTSAFLLTDRSSSPKSGGKETSWSVFDTSVSNLRQMHDDTRQIRSLKLSLSEASPNRPTGYVTGLCPTMLQLSFIVERCYLILNKL